MSDSKSGSGEKPDQSVMKVDTIVLGDVPAAAMGFLYQSVAQALSNTSHNATQAQQQTNITAQTANAVGVHLIYSSAKG